MQVFRAQIANTGFYIGTGLISVMGTSFSFLPIARDMVVSEIKDARNDFFAGIDNECVEDAGGNVDCPGAGMRGYGKFLGTAMVCALFEIGLGFMPPKVIKKLFPPVVSGATVMLIGGGLIAAGMKYAGGGVFCAEDQANKHAAIGFGPQLCNENGEVVLAYGAPE